MRILISIALVLRMLHLVRPDLIFYPIDVRVYCGVDRPSPPAASLKDIDGPEA
jgi:hypothetical protein